MSDFDITDLETILATIRIQASTENIRITRHAHEEMIEEDITLDEVLSAIYDSQILENYSEHKRGACCLICGFTHIRRPLHIVCTTAQPVLIIITVYEPKLPKWITPLKRRE